MRLRSKVLYPDLHRCQHCQKKLSSRRHLLRHVIRFHPSAAGFKCDQCGKYFTVPWSLRRHKKVHEKPYGCTHCKRRFSEFGNLKRHERTHSGERPYRCATCGKRFSLAVSLKRHRRVHSGEKPYPCDVCGKTFSEKGNRRRHRLIHRKCTITAAKYLEPKLGASVESLGGLFFEPRVVLSTLQLDSGDKQGLDATARSQERAASDEDVGIVEMEGETPDVAIETKSSPSDPQEQPSVDSSSGILTACSWVLQEVKNVFLNLKGR